MNIFEKMFNPFKSTSDASDQTSPIKQKPGKGQPQPLKPDSTMQKKFDEQISPMKEGIVNNEQKNPALRNSVEMKSPKKELEQIKGDIQSLVDRYNKANKTEYASSAPDLMSKLVKKEDELKENVAALKKELNAYQQELSLSQGHFDIKDQESLINVTEQLLNEGLDQLTSITSQINTLTQLMSKKSAIEYKIGK